MVPERLKGLVQAAAEVRLQLSETLKESLGWDYLPSFRSTLHSHCLGLQATPKWPAWCVAGWRWLKKGRHPLPLPLESHQALLPEAVPLVEQPAKAAAVAQLVGQAAWQHSS